MGVGKLPLPAPLFFRPLKTNILTKGTEAEMQEKLLREKEVCRLFNVSRSVARRWRDQGCPAMKIGGCVMFPVNELKAWVLGHANFSINDYVFDRILDDLLTIKRP
jgi:predicted DNA-binding transcriptional regulator AlpA